MSVLLLNYFNYDKGIEVPITIFVAKELVKELKNNYIVNPNNVLVKAISNINQKQKILGLLVSDTNESRFYFSETYIGKTITASTDKFIQNSRKYLYDFYTNGISLNEVLEKAGAKVINRLYCSDEKYDMDLSPEKLEKDTILNLLMK